MSNSETAALPPSLTFHRRVASLQRDKTAALEAIPQYEVRDVGVPKRNKDGEIVLQNGMPVIVEQRVLARDLVTSEWDDRIKAYEDGYKGHKGERPACIKV